MNETKLIEITQHNVPNDFEKILLEVEKDVAPILEDFETADYLKDVMFDYRISSYFLFRWIDSLFDPQAILYPGSGFDQVPKIAFGLEKVVHTSLEEYGKDGQIYFEELGDGIKVIADNASLPFPSSLFQVILLLDSSFESVGNPKEEILRVLGDGGILVIAQSVLQDDLEKNRLQHYLRSNNLREIPVPSDLQKKGPSNTTFHLICKLHD